MGIVSLLTVQTRQRMSRSFPQVAVRGIRNASHFNRSAKLADESILKYLVCPISKFPLRYDVERGSLVCDEINVEYPIWQGVPMLVPSEGRIIKSSDDDSSTSSMYERRVRE